MAIVARTETLSPGMLLAGKLRIERVIGQGSTGIVFEATDLALGRRVAVKLLSPERAKSHDGRTRFLREARAAVRLSSEHATRLIDAGELDNGTPYLVMEYLVGSTLEQLLVRDGPQPVDVVLDWVLQALDAVAEAHREGLVHRDLKPENLFLCERPGRLPIVKVLDFGTVKDLVTKTTKLTRIGSTMGSPAYMAPEQVRAEEIDVRADVWAIGVTIYELLTGQLPFGGDSVPQTLTAILRDEPQPLRSRRPDVPSALEAVIACALSKDRTCRYASAGELLDALAVVRGSRPQAKRLRTTLPLTRSVHGSSATDPFGDTTDMRSLMVGLESSRVRARIAVNDHTEARATVAEAKRSLVPIVLLALAIAIAIGVGAGVLIKRHHARMQKAAAAVSAPAPEPSPRAPLVAAATPPVEATAPPPAETVALPTPSSRRPPARKNGK